ncbi:hypothetical protein [Natrinema hispanicum]|uniref:Uncharacterized protein n=1 Tax=Natrinema hispanicum TaxID=392421 RepID=A0A1G6Q1Y2_9EURY|nr:hypothetical protein [Natrinema hispanicum]SDC85647.1 hypothetical protein SAMN05192552_100873 [Natrinema hispanicum]SET31694.1 hypothetical protein SAMN04488694_105160 [Natrinema hispanicum]
MNVGYTTRLEDFGARSLVTHTIMGLTFLGAMVSGLFIDGQLGLVSFVAFLNFTAGMWIAQSVHSLGNAQTDDSYTGILGIVAVLVDTTGEKRYHGLDTGRLARLLTLIALVTSVSLFVAGEVLTGVLAPVGTVAIAAVALVTAMVGFLIAMSSAYDASEREATRQVDRDHDRIETGDPRQPTIELEDGTDIEISVRESHVDEPATESR